jgi:hypothetical protein
VKEAAPGWNDGQYNAYAQQPGGFGQYNNGQQQYGGYNQQPRQNPIDRTLVLGGAAFDAGLGAD